jgi:hypothetical protein
VIRVLADGNTTETPAGVPTRVKTVPRLKDDLRAVSIMTENRTPPPATVGKAN